MSRRKADQHRLTLKRSETEIDRRRQSIEGLRNLVPQHIREQVESETRAVKASPIARELQNCKSRLRMVEGVLDRLTEVNLRTDDQIRNHVRSYRPDLYSSIVRQSKTAHGIQERVNVEGWHAYLQTLQAEIPDLQERIGLLEPQVGKELNDANQLLDHYWK